METDKRLGPLAFHYGADGDGRRTRTAAVVCPTPDAFEAAAAAVASGGNPRLVVGLGVSRVHPGDRFTKEEGRRLASGRVSYSEWDVAAVSAEPEGRATVTVVSGGGILVFRHVHGKGLVYLVNAHLPGRSA